MNRRHWLVLALCCVPAVALSCGGDGGGATANTAATITAKTVAAGGPSGAPSVDTTTAPKLTEPVSRFTVLHEEVGPAFRNNISATFLLDLNTYAGTDTFLGQDGRKLLGDWGYLGGFEESLVADGGKTDVLNGGFDFTVESHLFATEAGAKSAFIYFETIVKANKKIKATTMNPVGNQSSAWTLVDGKFDGTSIDVAYHRVIFRRGNLVVVVRTKGAAPFMTVDDAYGFAKLVDEKALGKVEAIEPTPVTNYVPPSSVSRSPTTPPGITPTPGPSATPRPSAPTARP